MGKLIRKKNGKFSFGKMIAWLLLVLLIIGGAFGFKVYQDIQAVRQSVVVNDVEVENLRGDDRLEIADGEPLNILLIGTDDDTLERDTSDGYVSRSDTLMMVTLNPANHTTKILSIPRDTLTTIGDDPSPDKINHAFAYGGAELTIDTVQNYLQVPIDYYAVVNMTGLTDLIDAIGGIEVTSPLTFEYRGTGFKKGETREVNGVKAMNFARMRYDDPEGEVGRQNRQKIVVKAVVDKLLSFDAITYYPQLLRVISENVRTNFDVTTALNIYQKYLPALDNISAIQFSEREETYINEVFYFHIPLNARLQVSNEIRQQLSMPALALSDLEDPLDSDIEVATTKVSIIFNQYPTGLTEDQTEEIFAMQEEAQSLRNTTNVDPEYVPPVNNNNNQESIYYPPVSSTPPVESVQPEEPIDPVEPPVSSQPPVSEPPEVSEPTVPVEPEVPVEPVEPTEPESSVEAPPVSSAPPEEVIPESSVIGE